MWATHAASAYESKALYFKAIRLFPQIRLRHNIHKQMRRSRAVLTIL